MENRQGQELRAQVNTSVFYRVVNVVFAALFFGVVLLSVFNNQSTAFAHSTPLLLLSAVLGVGVVFGASRLFSRLPTPGKIAEIISVCVGMVLFAALCFVVSFSLSGTPDPASDFGMVYSRAAAYATNGSLPDNYFLYYPTQQGFYVLLCGIFSFLKLLGVTNFLVPLVVINTVAVCGAVLLMYFCARRLFGVKKALFILVGAFFTVPFLLSGAVAYTYTITLPVPVAVMLLWMKTRGYWRSGENKKAILYFMLLSGIAAVGALLKLTVLVIYLAVLLDLLILLVGRGKLKMMGAGVGVCVAVFLLGTLLIKISPALPNYNTEADAIPLTSWIMMGLSENGADNQADLDLILHRPNKDARDAFVSQEIADRFGDYMPFGIFTHFGNKLAYTFGDPTLGLAQQLGTGTTGLRGLFLPGGSGFAGLCYAAFGLQMAVLVWAAVAAAKSLYRKNDALTFARLAMLGLLVFLLLWKTEPGEIVTFVPVFLLCGLEASPAPMLALQKKRAREALQTNVAPQDTTMELESASLDFLGRELESDDNQGWPQEPSAALAPQEPEPVVEPEPAPEPGQEPAFEPEQEPASGQLEESIWQQDIQEPEIQDTPLFELEPEPAPELAPEEQNWADQAIQEAFAQGYDVEYTTEDGQVFYQQPDGRTYYIAEDGQAYYYPQEGEEGYYAEDGQFYYYPGYEPYAQQVFVDTPDGQQVYYQDYYDMPDEPYWDEETQQWYVPQPAGELTGEEGYEYGPQWQQPYQEPETAQLEWSEEDTAREDVAEPAYQPETPGEPVAPELDAFEPEAMEPQLEEPVFQPVPQDDALTEAEMAEDVQLWGMADEQPPAPESELEPEPEATVEWEAEPEPELVPELTLWPVVPELEEPQAPVAVEEILEAAELLPQPEPQEAPPLFEEAPYAWPQADTDAVAVTEPEPEVELEAESGPEIEPELTLWPEVEELAGETVQEAPQAEAFEEAALPEMPVAVESQLQEDATIELWPGEETEQEEEPAALFAEPEELYDADAVAEEPIAVEPVVEFATEPTPEPVQEEEQPVVLFEEMAGEEAAFVPQPAVPGEPEPALTPELTLWPELGLDEQPELEENQPAEEWQPDEPAAYTEEPDEPEELYAQPVLAVGETAPVDEYEAVAFDPEPEPALAAITFISEEPEDEEYSFELLPATEHAELAEEFDATEESVGFELFAEAETAEDEDGVFALPVLDIPEELEQADEPVTVAEDAAELQLFPEAELPEETPFEAEPLDEEVIPEPVEDDVAAKEERKLPLWLEVELEEALQKRRETLTEVDVDKLLQEPGEPLAEEPQQEPAQEEPEEEVMLEASPVLDVPDEAEEEVESVPDVLQMLDAELERVIAPEEIEEEPPVNEAEPEPEDEPEALQAEETAPIQEEPEPQRPKITDEAVDDIIALLHIKRRAAEKRREMEAMAEVFEPVELTAEEEESIALEPAQPEEEPAVAEWAAPVATVHEDAPVSLFDTEPDVSPEPEPEAELEAKVETMPETTPEAEEREEPEPAQEESPSPELAAQREELLMRALEFATGGQPIAPPAPKTPAAPVQAQTETPAAAAVEPQPVMQQPEAAEPVAPPVVVQPQAQPATPSVPVIRQVQPTAAPQPAAMAPGTPPKRRPVVIQRVAPAPQYPAPPVDEVEAILQSLRRSAPPAHIAAVSAVQPKAVGRPVVPPAPVHTQPVNTVESVLKSLEQTAARPAAAPRPAQPAPVQPRENADWNTLHNAINNGLPQDRRYEVKKPSAYDELMKIVDHAKPEDKPR